MIDALMAQASKMKSMGGADVRWSTEIDDAVFKPE
jgi:hypothetical protein